MGESKTTYSEIYSLLPYQNCLECLESNASKGLLHQQVSQRTILYGENTIPKQESETLWQKIISQVNNPLILLLLGSAFVSLLLSHFDDAISITLAVIIVLTVAFIQEYKTEQSLKELEKLSPFYSQVRRDGNLSNVSASHLVPGDIVYFSSGDRIPADIRIIECNGLTIDESSLTGETIAILKSQNPISHSHYETRSYSHERIREFNIPQRVALAERRNIAFMGTLVKAGNGFGVVIATGIHTELGDICKIMNQIEVHRTPLQLSMDALGQQLSFASIVIIIIITLIGISQSRNILDMFTIAVSLAVAAIPEGLPIVVTVTLALGVLRMANKNAIIKRLPLVETLGSVSVICIDKTGIFLIFYNSFLIFRNTHV